jgi:hypothetical protein
VVEQDPNLITTDVRKIVVVVPDLKECYVFRQQRSHFVAMAACKAPGAKMGNRNCSNDLAGAQQLYRFDGAEHGPARVHTIINDDGSPCGEAFRSGDAPSLEIGLERQASFLSGLVDFCPSKPGLAN